MDVQKYIVLIAISLSLIAYMIHGVLSQRRKLNRLESEVRFLFEQTGLTYDPVSILTPAIRKAVAEGRTIEAIRLYKEATGESLKASKDAVERIGGSVPPAGPREVMNKTREE